MIFQGPSRTQVGQNPLYNARGPSDLTVWNKEFKVNSNVMNWKINAHSNLQLFLYIYIFEINLIILFNWGAIIKRSR